MKYLMICVLMSINIYAQEIIKIGVLAKRSAEVSYKRWNDTAEYLTNKIEDKKFVIVPVQFDDVNQAVQDKEFSFILTNSGMYVDLEYKYAVQRITTLQNKHISGIVQKEFGGVLITHIKNRDKYNDLDSIVDTTIAAVNKKSFGGWQMLWRELVEHGIDIESDIKSIDFKGSHDKVVYSVLSGEYDLGTVRTDTIERMAKEGKIDLKKIHVVNQKKYDDFPFYVSTKLYPEWPMAKLKDTPDQLSKEVSIALMNMRSDSKAAISASVIGWTIPLNYQPIHECFKILEIAPYFQKIEFMDVIEKYWAWILFYLFMGVNGIAMLIYQVRITKNLKMAQEELVQTEKMASLGRLVAGVAHEINTPIGVGVTAASHLHKETKNFEKNYKAENITKTSFEDFIDVSLQSSEMILANLDRAAKMIHNFKQISVDQSSDEVREFDIKEYIDSVISSLKPVLKTTSHNIEVLCESDFVIESNPGVLSQIFSNLIMNSVIHGFDNISNGNIQIEVVKKSQGIQIIYTDDGKGMSKENLKKIFDPFFTTKRSQGGSGLGTHIIFNLITQKLFGTITAQSEEGNGLKYIIDLKEIKHV
ncbi:sensor histidine kinase [Sulfurimonas sp.]|nr:sensor histidine kinase [Sulfurimonas sp.]